MLSDQLTLYSDLTVTVAVFATGARTNTNTATRRFPDKHTRVWIVRKVSADKLWVHAAVIPILVCVVNAGSNKLDTAYDWDRISINAGVLLGQKRRHNLDVIAGALRAHVDDGLNAVVGPILQQRVNERLTKLRTGTLRAAGRVARLPRLKGAADNPLLLLWCCIISAHLT